MTIGICTQRQLFVDLHLYFEVTIKYEATNYTVGVARE